MQVCETLCRSCIGKHIYSFSGRLLAKRFTALPTLLSASQPRSLEDGLSPGEKLASLPLLKVSRVSTALDRGTPIS